MLILSVVLESAAGFSSTYVQVFQMLPLDMLSAELLVTILSCSAASGNLGLLDDGIRTDLSL
jgi:hypothetical protein